MSFYDFFRMPDINAGVKQFASTPKAVLLDVRGPEEYAGGHIPRSRNISLDRIASAPKEIPDHSTPLFVYCLSGARSRQAISALKGMGYENATNIGGISSYRGAMER